MLHSTKREEEGKRREPSVLAKELLENAALLWLLSLRVFCDGRVCWAVVVAAVAQWIGLRRLRGCGLCGRVRQSSAHRFRRFVDGRSEAAFIAVTSLCHSHQNVDWVAIFANALCVTRTTKDL